jgi:hypothetical protein
MARVGLSKKPLWDTEVNYGDRRSAATQVVPSPKKAATYVARTYLDSARYGIARTFWYGWDINVLGISMSLPDGSPTRAGLAYTTVEDWMQAGKWRGCATSAGVTRCRVGGSQIVFASGKKTITLPKGLSERCTLNGTCKPAPARIKVGAAPTRLS